MEAEEVLAVDLPVEPEVVQLVEPEEPEVPVEPVEPELVPEVEPVVLELEELEEWDQIRLTSLSQPLIGCTSTIGVPYQFFSGLPNEDPTQFKQKALDYMEDALIPAIDRPRKFRLCLQGKARDWYNKITVPAQWDALMNMFCQHFCIFGQTEEQWHKAWQKLSFDHNSVNIDQFINKVKQLARQLQFHNKSILIKLKQLFPEKADMWLVVHDLDEMCGYLKKLYSPYQLQQWKDSSTSKDTSSGATPFSNMKLLGESYNLKVGTQSKSVHFDQEELLDRAVTKLTNAMNQLAYQKPDRRRQDNYSP